MNPVDVLSRWLHVGTAIVLLGGTAYIRFVLMPAAKQLPDVEHEKLRELVTARWKRFVHGGIALLLLTGFYNYFQATPADAFRKQYHMLVGIKILLALAVFALGSALVGRSRALAGLRQSAATWLGVVLLLGAVIVGISSYLKVAGQAALRGPIPAAAAPAD
uniref:Copper resistance protein D domain-containing protein n=1 Tax=Schlesneria paludicola TaxID=360056 RepID=A0A7C2JX80_9PLAN